MDSETYYLGACFAGVLAAIPSAFFSGIATFELAMAFGSETHLANGISCIVALGIGWLAFLKVKQAVLAYFERK